MGARAMTEIPYDEHRPALFGLCYRMTGSAADAEDLVQETFRRAIERPPADPEAPLAPWLKRVATNLCIDALRRRQRERYFGPWLPTPIDTERVRDDLEPGPEARYGVLESASAAFQRPASASIAPSFCLCLESAASSRSKPAASVAVPAAA